MPRKPRQLLDGGCYHLIARGNNRQFVFRDETAFRHFLDLLARAKARYPSKLYHYCLMSNHLHLLVEIERGIPGTGYWKLYRVRKGQVKQWAATPDR